MIFEYVDYKRFLTDLIQTYPNRGRGQARKLADYISVNSVVVSQILSGSREFSIEQSLKVAEFFGLDERSGEYFLLLVSRARAGSKDLEKYYDRKLEALRKEAKTIKNQIVKHRELSESDKGIFYSNWYYSGIRLLSSIPGFHSVDRIASYFSLSRSKVAEVVSFLVSRGLCIDEDGEIKFGVTATHVDSSSRFVNNHRRNWRIKALEKFSEPGPNDLFFSSPYSLSEKDAEHIRKEITRLISQTSKRVGESPCEKLVCLNIDWFEF